MKKYIWMIIFIVFLILFSGFMIFFLASCDSDYPKVTKKPSSSETVVVAPVPEPSTFFLFGPGILALKLFKRKK